MKFAYAAAALVLVVIVIIVAMSNSASPGLYDNFARCLSEKDFKFYGAYWCSHCIQQKELFGSSADKLPYIECSLPKNAGQTAVCTAAGITSYPTWVLPSGKRLSGTLSLQELATLSGCALNTTS